MADKSILGRLQEGMGKGGSWICTLGLNSAQIMPLPRGAKRRSWGCGYHHSIWVVPTKQCWASVNLNKNWPKKNLSNLPQIKLLQIFCLP